MALKSKLTKAEFDALPDALKEHYKESNGSYLLDSDDAAELRRAKEAAAEEANAAKAEAARLRKEKEDADEEARKAREEAARKKGDVTALEASWQEKLTAVETKHANEIADLNNQIDELTVRAEARRIAAEISTVPELVEDAIAKRLRREVVDGKPTVRTLDATGQPSAKTLGELQEEFVANPKYAAIMIGSMGSGGGASQSTPAGGGAPTKKINEMTETERVTHFNKVGAAEFERQVAAERAMA